METECFESIDSVRKKELFTRICNTCLVDITNMLSNDSSLISLTDEHERTPLHYAVIQEHLQVVNLLLRFNPDINRVDNKKKTPLHWACDVNNLEIVKLLMPHNADINLNDEHGKTPLHWAVIRANKEVVKILLEHNANVDCTDNENRTPLFYACSKDSLDIIEILLYHKPDVNLADKYGVTPLHLAVSKNNMMSINYLFMYNVNVNCVDNCNQTPLHWACNNETSGPVACMLLNGGADMESTDKNGRTPFHVAVKMQNYDLVEILKDTDINIFDNTEKSAAHYALENLASIDYSDVMADYSIPWQLIEQIILLKYANSYIDHRILSLIYTENLDNDLKREISLIEHLYQEEVEDLRKYVIIGSKFITSHDLLTMSIHALTKYVNDKNIQRIFDSKNNFNENAYSYLIQRHYRKAVERCKLLETVEPYFQSSVFSNLPFLCLDKIISYLRNRDLKRLIDIIKS